MNLTTPAIALEEKSTIWAIKATPPQENPELVASLFDELKAGRARFGWSYHDDLDLTLIKQRLEAGDPLSEPQREAWSKAKFLLGLQSDDLLVYINMPSYGECTIVKVDGNYDFSHLWNSEPDFRHVVACTYIATFNRNNDVVPPLLRARLKLMGASYRIHCRDEVQELLETLHSGRSGRSAQERLFEGMDQVIAEAVVHLQKNGPRHALEKLVMDLFSSTGLNVNKGPDRNGADLEITVPRQPTGIPGIVRDELCAVQVKSYTGAIDVGGRDAIDDLKRAFASKESYSCGLIVTTATEMTPAFDQKFSAFREAEGRRGRGVGIILGDELARIAISTRAKLDESPQ